jgi:hypothetical protein
MDNAQNAMAGVRSDRNWLADIIWALRGLEGAASLPQIYRHIENHRSCLPTEWKSAVRATIYVHSSNAKAFVKGNPDVFKRLERGVWGLRLPKDFIDGRSEQALSSAAFQEMTIEEFQGCQGDAEKLFALVHARMAGIRKRFRMT